jgi:glycosyltransferase involved in cell wall biosynthesis
MTMNIRTMTRAERAWSMARLWPHAIGVVSNRRLAKPFRPTRFATSDSEMNVSDPISRIDSAESRDLSSSFMLFEGSRQLPPIQVSHEDIRTLGAGRYSVWNQQILFAATRPQRQFRLPYWVVPRNEQTEPHLQLVPRFSNEKLSGCPDSVSRVQELLARPVADSFALKRGDAVAICTHALAPGGAERQWVLLAQALSKAGYDVAVVVYHPLSGGNAHYLPQLADAGIRVVDASAIPLIAQAKACERIPGAADLLKSGLVPEHGKLMRLTAALAGISPKVVITQLDEPNIVAAFAAHLCGAERVVLSFRNYNPTHFPYIDKPWYREAYRHLARSGRVLFSGNHREANRDYAQWIGIAPDRVALIPNVIDRGGFPAPSEEQLRQTRAELGLTEDVPVLLGAFRLSEEKDPLAFIEVCNRIAQEVPNLRAFLVGAGPMRAQLEEHVAKLGLGHRITLLGRRNDVHVLMTIATVFLLTSLKEGMPNVLMEAQLSGTPVVATETSGTASVVKSGETALLRPVGDVAGLAQACVRLMSDRESGKRMGQAGQHHVREAFSPDLLAARYIALLQGKNTGVTGNDVTPSGLARMALAG